MKSGSKLLPGDRVRLITQHTSTGTVVSVSGGECVVCFDDGSIIDCLVNILEAIHE